MLKIQSLSFYYACRLFPQTRGEIPRYDVTLTFLEVETVLFSIWRRKTGRRNVSYFPGGMDWQWLRRDQSAVRVAISQTIAEKYRREFHLQIDGVAPPGIEREWLEADYAPRAKPTLLIFVGRLEANKGLHELLHTFRKLVAVEPELHLKIIGDGPLRGSLQRETETLGLSRQVSFCGELPRSQVRAELQRADLFVYPSQYESFGLAVLEAMAVGVPVLCSDLPALREVTGGAAKLLPLGDSDLWVESIQHLLHDLSARRRLSHAGRARARKFTWAQSVQKLVRCM
jgi:glycosyltransferase involved in cell wall biosynthesis